MAAGVPCGPVRTVADVAHDPHALHRNLFVEIGAYRGTASPVKLSRTPATYRSPPPALGGATRAVLERRGGDPALQQQLLDAGVLKAEPEAT